MKKQWVKRADKRTRYAGAAREPGRAANISPGTLNLNTKP